MPVKEETSEQLELFVSEHLADTTSYSRRKKVIHETLWGTNLFKPHEIALIDTSLFQRLRFIHQTGLSYLTFPTALHTRFDHSLGVLVQCGKFAQSVAERLEDKDLLQDYDIDNLRFAGLIHDIWTLPILPYK